MERQIEKPWCVYGGLTSRMPDGFGRVVDESQISISIQYSEGQLYSPESWDKKYTRRFDTLQEALDFFIEHKPQFDIRDRQLTDSDIMDLARRSFPSYQT